MFSTAITSEQINEVIKKLIDGGIDLGGRILAALIIYVIGKTLINWANTISFSFSVMPNALLLHPALLFLAYVAPFGATN